MQFKQKLIIAAALSFVFVSCGESESDKSLRKSRISYERDLALSSLSSKSSRYDNIGSNSFRSSSYDHYKLLIESYPAKNSDNMKRYGMEQLQKFYEAMESMKISYENYNNSFENFQAIKDSQKEIKDSLAK